MSKILSMTSYALCSQKGADAKLTWEIKSVNARFLDIQIKLPFKDLGLEQQLKKIIQAKTQRGKIEANLKIVSNSSRIKDDAKELTKLNRLLEEIRKRIPETRAITFGEISEWLRDDHPHKENSIPVEQKPIISLFSQTLEIFISRRASEGMALGTAIARRLSSIEDLLSAQRDDLSRINEKQRRELRRRTKLFGSKIGEDRILQELAILAQKSDIHEELDRLQAHTKDCKKLLSSKGPHGKRIDFIAQELNREANTMGSKSTDIQSSRRALDLKILIEQIREQTQNIE
jgi:uncharacterized protein (TIGR00255 family)